MSFCILSNFLCYRFTDAVQIEDLCSKIKGFRPIGLLRPDKDSSCATGRAPLYAEYALNHLDSFYRCIDSNKFTTWLIKVIWIIYAGECTLHIYFST